MNFHTFHQKVGRANYTRSLIRTGLFSEDMRRAACPCLTTTDEPQPCRGSSTGNRGELGGEQTDDLMGLPPSLPGTSVNGVRATLPASLRDVGRRMMTSFPAPHRFKNGRCLPAHLSYATIVHGRTHLQHTTVGCREAWSANGILFVAVKAVRFYGCFGAPSRVILSG